MTAAITQLFNWSAGRCYTVAAEREKDSFMSERFRQGRGCSAHPSGGSHAGTFIFSSAGGRKWTDGCIKRTEQEIKKGKDEVVLKNQHTSFNHSTVCFPVKPMRL